MEATAVAEVFRDLGEMVRGRSPLYERLVAGFAGAAERGFDGGVLGRLMDMPGPAGPDEARLLILAALQDAAIRDPGLPHAAWFGQAAGPAVRSPEDGAPGALALAYLIEHEDEVSAYVSHARLQTNEVARCAALLPGFLEAASFGQPLRLIELGSSAGLHLRFDRYHYRYDGGPQWGPAGGPTLHTRAEGAAPRSLSPPTVHIDERIAVDLDPVDVSDPTAVRRLHSFVWADEADRHRLLDDAIRVARATPVRQVAADIVQYVSDDVSATEDVTTVLFHSQVRDLLAPEAVGGLEDAIEHVLRSASPTAPVVHLSFEAPRGTAPHTAPELDVAISADDGPPRRRTLVAADWEGRWVRWFPS